MDRDDIQARIAAWQAAGLIEADAADRLRDYEQTHAAASTPAPPAPALSASAGPNVSTPARERGAGSTAASFFGPAVSVAELFGYLGTAFVLAAWQAFVSTNAGDFAPSDPASRLLQLGVPAAVLFVPGVVLRGRGPALSRAAGVAFLVSVSYVAATAYAVADAAFPDAQYEVLLTISGACSSVVALIARRLHPAVLTQIGLISTLLLLAGGALSVIDEALFPASEFGFEDEPSVGSVDAIVRLAGTAVWWIAWAVGLGAMTLFEVASASRARSKGDVAEAGAAGRRAGLTRFFAGLVAVAGTASAVTQSNFGERVLPVWFGDLVLLAVACGLWCSPSGAHRAPTWCPPESESLRR